MPPEPNSLAIIHADAEAVYRLYLGLGCFMRSGSLGGQLLYAGVPDAAGCRLLRAANIAGAASLAASPDASLLRDAMRGGALDFVVNSLDEALRILKNEIRKQQPVAVGVSIEPELLLREMCERGVQPDLLAPELTSSPEAEALAAGGAQTVLPGKIPNGVALHILPIPAEWTEPAAAFDSMLLECLAADDALNCRWVRFSARYLPGAARRLRSIACDAQRLEDVRALTGNGGS